MSAYRTEQNMQMDLPRVVVNLLEMLLKPNRQEMNTKKCFRCGEFHSFYSVCKAKNRKCYNCRKYGHYSNLCKTKMATAPEIQPERIHSNIEEKKTEKSLNLLQEVNSVIEERKMEELYICEIMPYFELENNVIIKENNFNSSLIVKCKKLGSQVNKVSKVKKSVKTRDITTNTETSNDNNTRNTNVEIIRILIKEIGELSTLMSSMFYIFNDWGKSEDWVDYPFYKDDFYCKKCGSKEFHGEDWCPKTRIKTPCQLCNAPEHFTAFCSKLIV